MSLKRNENRLFDFSKITSGTVFLYLFLITFLIRFPFFFRDYIDRDESTFILLGQSWADGFLPYTQLWDLKPPLTFAFFAILISLFGKSFIAIRLAGVLLVCITSFFTFKIASKLTTKKASFSAAIGCVVLLSLFGSLQGVMSEHLCMAFFMPALYLLLRNKKRHQFFLAGVLMGITVMVKLNMAFPILFIGLYIAADVFRKDSPTNVLRIILFGLGVLLVITATIWPYYSTGQFQIWWDSVILAPLEYTEARRYPILKLAPFFIVVSAFLAYSWKKKILDFRNPVVQLLIVSIIGVLFSFLKGGRINGHYLIQLHPMLLILVAVVILRTIQIYHLKITKYAALILLLIPAESYLEYFNVIKNKIAYGTFYNGEGFSVPRYIAAHNLETKNILFFEYHIGYWNLNTLPPSTASTHPSNLCRDELFPFYKNPRKNSLEEIRYLMEQLQPKTIVIRKGKRIFDKKEIEENQYIDDYLEKNYSLLATVENAEILQRLE
ncbi:MAG: glycosyltransferase family 39 protein [Maribacter sp.]